MQSLAQASRIFLETRTTIPAVTAILKTVHGRPMAGSSVKIRFINIEKVARETCYKD